MDTCSVKKVGNHSRRRSRTRPLDRMSMHSEVGRRILALEDGQWHICQGSIWLYFTYTNCAGCLWLKWELFQFHGVQWTTKPVTVWFRLPISKTNILRHVLEQSLLVKVVWLVKGKGIFNVGGQTGKDCLLTWAEGVKVADRRDRTRNLLLRKRCTNHCTTDPASCSQLLPNFLFWLRGKEKRVCRPRSSVRLVLVQVA